MRDKGGKGMLIARHSGICMVLLVRCMILLIDAHLYREHRFSFVSD